MLVCREETQPWRARWEEEEEEDESIMLRISSSTACIATSIVRSKCSSKHQK